ncbi:hypothetical protein GCM10009665_37750 [Kitasatospora nipponensis]|uniref:Transposase n=1 Tax=Kitasatospora nipponensis TaxID=258049 RepID=A0ABP4H1F7_9ACTN
MCAPQSDADLTGALEADIKAWIAVWNENPRPFTWTKPRHGVGLATEPASGAADVPDDGCGEGVDPWNGGRRQRAASPGHPPGCPGEAARSRRDSRAAWLVPTMEGLPCPTNVMS